MLAVKNVRIAIIGLGYVGLPLAVEFGKKAPTVGFDVNATRIQELHQGHDRTFETTSEDFAAATLFSCTGDLETLRDCNVYIVTVPTPIDAHKQPDLGPLRKASETVGQVISKGDVVIYESTVYPGATEEDCIPIVEATSGLIYNQDFFAGYSPERINPGDKEHRLPTIKKVTAGSTPETGAFVDALYQTIITAGTHLAPTIRVAEAAKVIENTQRDVNIALVNELALIFNRMGIDTLDVLEAAGTKWNFLPFRPGLVGGHCIGVDPYYLTHKAQSLGYYPEVVLSGRRINDGMGAYIANQLIRTMISREVSIPGSRVLVMGLTFKEDCPDLRNSRVIDIIAELRGYGIEPDVCDPWANADDAEREYGVQLITPIPEKYDAVVVAVGHKTFLSDTRLAPMSFIKQNGVIFDVKGILPAASSILRL